MSQFAVILPAAGQSRRFKDPHYKKPFANLAGRAVWLHAAEKFLNRDDCAQCIVAISPEDREEFERKFGANAAIMGVDLVDGGQERADSIEAALARIKPEVELVAVHDAARPCLAEAWLADVLAAAEQHGAAILARRVVSTLKRVADDRSITETVAREGLWEAQTPQVFRRELLLQAYAQRDGFVATDDAQLVERIGAKVVVVEGSPLNLKITTKADLKLAELALKALPKPKLDGFSHPFADDLFR